MYLYSKKGKRASRKATSVQSVKSNIQHGLLSLAFKVYLVSHSVGIYGLSPKKKGVNFPTVYITKAVHRDSNMTLDFNNTTFFAKQVSLKQEVMSLPKFCKTSYKKRTSMF